MEKRFSMGKSERRKFHFVNKGSVAFEGRRRFLRQMSRDKINFLWRRRI
jgi:hypothetical protein